MTPRSTSAAVRSSTVVELLRARAAESPERTAYTFLRDGEVEEARLTCAGLDVRARAIASFLQGRGLAGERALLLFPPGLEFVSAFFGCLYAGVIAVPAYPPRAHRPDARIQDIAADAQPAVVLTTEAVRSALEPRRAQNPALAATPWIATDALADAGAASWREPDLAPDALAFLQYTSGSTRTPKGVMVSHGNVLANSAEIDEVARQDENSVSVSWLPHFHDMGLIYGVIYPVYRGFPGILMAPAAFLQRPLRWLQAASTYGATTSGGPNFAYELCTSRVTAEERARLDLSRWDIAFNGAEPLRASTLDAFARAFAPCGFRRTSLMAAYGMAEATLMVSLTAKHREPTYLRADAAALERNEAVPAADGDAGARVLVGCGEVSRQRVLIADPATGRACADGQVGEIWLRGPSVARGYWNRPAETAATFGAMRADAAEGPFLRTGDLGLLREGELFVTGRLKDMIIIRGLNHYPQDVEHTVHTSHPALRPDAGAAFSVEAGGEERLVVVQEVDRVQHRRAAMDEVIAAIRRAVTEEHEVEPWAIVLIRHATIAKTSSGKIQRQACRSAYLAGGLAVVAEWRKPEARPAAADNGRAGAGHTESDITSWLVSRLAQEAGLEADEIDLEQPFAAFGLDSARSLLLIGDLEAWLGRPVSPVVLWNYPTVEALARHLGA
jgi:acyl-CoA synthetase (AMP-forming)/AMP-acid ligase II/acyl carrier protein